MFPVAVSECTTTETRPEPICSPVHLRPHKSPHPLTLGPEASSRHREKECICPSVFFFSFSLLSLLLLLTALPSRQGEGWGKAQSRRTLRHEHCPRPRLPKSGKSAKTYQTRNEKAPIGVPFQHRTYSLAVLPENLAATEYSCEPDDCHSSSTLLACPVTHGNSR